MEGKNSKADVVLGLDNNLLEAAAQSKLFAKSNVPASAVSVPGGWDNDTFVPYDYGYFAFVYDKNKLANPPKSLKELVEGPQKWRVIYEDPRTSTPGLGLLLWMQKVYGDQAPEAPAEAGRENRYRHQRLERSLWPVPERGKRLVLSYTTSPAYHMIEEKKDNYAAASFAEATICRSKLPRVPPPASSRNWRKNSSNLWYLLASRTPSLPATGCIR